MSVSKIEILFIAWNRLEYTQVAFELLKRNTDWRRVSRLVVYDDGSTDGTREYLAEAGREIEVEAFEVRDSAWRSLGATMNDFVSLTESELFVKIDNDIAMPPGWLPRVLGAWRRNQEYELIGMEAAWNGAYQGLLAQNKYGVVPCRHIGGVGLMRTKAFEWRKPVPLSLGKNGRAGFTIWQHRYRPKVAWLNPDLPNVQLDKIPDEPWASLAARYCAEGWSRPWEPYTHDMHGWWGWIPEDVVPA